jgi:hypothetical protein
LFITDFWIGPRVTKLLQYLSDPITDEQAEVLAVVTLRRVELDEMIQWLEFGNITWNDYVETHLRPELKRFKSMLHLWLGEEAIFREPPLVCRVRVDRIDRDIQEVSVQEQRRIARERAASAREREDQRYVQQFASAIQASYMPGTRSAGDREACVPET